MNITWTSEDKCGELKHTANVLCFKLSVVIHPVLNTADVCIIIPCLKKYSDIYSIEIDEYLYVENLENRFSLCELKLHIINILYRLLLGIKCSYGGLGNFIFCKDMSDSDMRDDVRRLISAQAIRMLSEEELIPKLNYLMVELRG
jgi:hypothetical protein